MRAFADEKKSARGRRRCKADLTRGAASRFVGEDRPLCTGLGSGLLPHGIDSTASAAAAFFGRPPPFAPASLGTARFPAFRTCQPS